MSKKKKKDKAKQESAENESQPKEKQEQLGNKEYLKHLQKLQLELVKLQEWIKAQGLRVVVIFEGSTRENSISAQREPFQKKSQPVHCES